MPLISVITHSKGICNTRVSYKVKKKHCRTKVVKLKLYTSTKFMLQ